LRPWFDTVALNAIAKWFCPLSRGWAAACVSEGSKDQFIAELGISSDEISIKPSKLQKVHASRRRYGQTKNNWEDVYFGDSVSTPEELVRAQRELASAEHEQLRLRRLFLSHRSRMPLLKWSVATPQEVAAIHQTRLTNEAFPAPPETEIMQSVSVLGEWGEEFHLKLQSPTDVSSDTARAHVFLPEDGKIRATLVLLHGICLEPVMWDALAYPAKALTRQGVRVVLPTGPWHGRRAPEGQFGGENILMRGPLGFIDAFKAWVAESALWIRWSRSTANGPVGLGGVSLGALTAQLATVASRDWPDNDQPDAIMLITTSGDMTDVAFGSVMADKLTLTQRISEKRWTAETLSQWLPLLQPEGEPVISQEKIVMLLGSADRLTPFEGGLALAQRWKIPEENLFIRRQGHFSGALGLSHDATPLKRFTEILLQS
tara:strand:- start:2879 stop:4171 length:1293 start_codon:yes stop_codon:yes gene_type:complete